MVDDIFKDFSLSAFYKVSDLQFLLVNLSSETRVSNTYPFLVAALQVLGVSIFD